MTFWKRQCLWLTLNFFNLNLVDKVFCLLKGLFVCIRSIRPICPHVCLCTTFMQCLKRPEDGVRPPRTGIADSYELSAGCWERKPGSLEEQSVLASNIRASFPVQLFYLKNQNNLTETNPVGSHLPPQVIPNLILMFTRNFMNDTCLAPTFSSPSPSNLSISTFTLT